MTLRVIVIFFFALGGVAYLLGSSDSRDASDFYIAALAAAVITFALFRWLYAPRRKAVDLFDPEVTRRAVQRGTAQTAVTAVTWVAVGLWILSIATDVWQTRGDRETHFRNLVYYGVLALNPGYAAATNADSIRSRTGLRSLKVDLPLQPRTASGVRQQFNVRIELDLRGRLEYLDRRGWPPAPIENALSTTLASSPGPTKSQTKALLEGLSEGVVASAIVALRHPMPIGSLYRLLRSHTISPNQEDIPIFLQSTARTPPQHRGTFQQYPLSWPRASVAEFQTWAKGLRSKDNKALDKLGLPPLGSIRVIATNPRVYGFILTRARIPILQGLFADHAVARLIVADAAFDLVPPGNAE